MNQHFDVVVIGGGHGGCLAAGRLLHSNPSLRVAILEKESFLGGRMRTTSSDQNRKWGHGLNSMSLELYQYWNQTLKLNPEGFDLPSLVSQQPQNISILSAGKNSQIPLNDFPSLKALKILGGQSATTDAELLRKLLSEPSDAANEARKDQDFASAWTPGRKSPTLAAIQPLATAIGITDMLESALPCLQRRFHSLATEVRSQDWHLAVTELLQTFIQQQRLALFLNHEAFQIRRQENSWEIATAQAVFHAPRVVIAHSPWEAANWIDKELWPAPLLNFVSKARPASMVVMTEQLLSGENHPPIASEKIYIASEETLVCIQSGLDISYQIAMDYEISHQAPDVVKNVKKLKRAKRKLAALYPEIQTRDQHIALVPVAWSVSGMLSDYRLSEKLAQNKIQNCDGLYFCGDAYGNLPDGDLNLIASVQATCASIGSSSETTECAIENDDVQNKEN